jgi:hypothetical protein
MLPPSSWSETLDYKSGLGSDPETTIWIETAVETLHLIYYIIVTCIPIARQRLSKHIPAKRTHVTEGRPLLGNGPVNKQSNKPVHKQIHNVTDFGT